MLDGIAFQKVVQVVDLLTRVAIADIGFNVTVFLCWKMG